MSRNADCKERKDLKKTSRRKSSRKTDDERSSRHKKHRKDDTKLPKGAKMITKEDYFVRQTEFRVWLAQTKYVDDLSTDEARELFNAEFVKKWNHGKLATMFYQGLPETVVEQTKRTRHCWSFVAALGEKEKFELATTKDSVGVATRTENMLKWGANRQSITSTMEKKSKHKREDERGTSEEKADSRDDSKKRRKGERSRQREHRDMVMDELSSKATGREAQIEKRRQIGARLHGAARDRENALDGLDLSDEFLMGGHGGGSDDWKRQMTRRDSARRRKQEEQEEKVARLKAKECARMDKFLEDMGLARPNTN